MKGVFKMVRSTWDRVPAGVKKAGERVALAFVASFVATAKPMLPALVGSPDLGTAKALAVAAVAAGAAAGWHTTRPLLAKLLVGVLAKQE